MVTSLITRSGGASASFAKCLLTVGRVGDRASGCRQATADDLAKHRLVVDDEDRGVDEVGLWLRPGLGPLLCVAGLGRLHSGCLARPAEITNEWYGA